MKSTIISLVMATAVAVSSCKKNVEPAAIIAPLNDNSLPSGAVASAQVIKKANDELTIALDFYVFRDSKNLEGQLTAGNFVNDTITESGTKYYYTLHNASLSGGDRSNSYSALLLMDQSGSIVSTDPSNHRIKAAQTFANNLGPGDNIMLWSFAGGSTYYSTNIVQYGTGFSGLNTTLSNNIESLAGKASGNTPLYNSQYLVTNYCAANAPLPNKAVMTFTDGQNTESGYTPAQVTSNAISRKVKLYNIGLGQAQINELCNQSFATGGAFMFAKDARQLISMFGNLGKLLDKTGQYYHTVWTVKRNGSFASGGSLSHSIKITPPYGGKIEIPFYLNY